MLCKQMASRQIVLLVGLLLLTGASTTKAAIAVSAPSASQTIDDLTQRVQQGRSQYQAGQYAQAIVLWQQAEIEYNRRNDRLNRALVLSYLASTQQQIGALSEAAQLIKTSSDSLKGMPQNSRVLAQVLNTQGSIEFSQGQIEAALATWQRATTLYAQLGEETARIGSLLNQVQAQQALGLLIQAKNTLRQVEQLLQNQSDPELKATALRNLGDRWLLMGDAVRSRQILEQSLKLQASSATLLSLGNVARSQKDTTAALVFYQRSNTPQALLNQFS